MYKGLAKHRLEVAGDGVLVDEADVFEEGDRKLDLRQYPSVCYKRLAQQLEERYPCDD